jgi:hypothetical protein
MKTQQFGADALESGIEQATPVRLRPAMSEKAYPQKIWQHMTPLRQ